MIQVANEEADELVPLSETEFYVLEGYARLAFIKDAGGKVTGLKAWQNGQAIPAKRIQ
jgi:hypothetical protein